MHRTLRLAIPALATLLLSAAAAPVLAETTPVDNGCPASAELTSVAWLETQGPYQLPGRLDDPANGGNGDGYICAFPLPEAAAKRLPVPIVYQFFENNLPAEGRP